jgi:hypothetical protein
MPIGRGGRKASPPPRGMHPPALAQSQCLASGWSTSPKSMTMLSWSKHSACNAAEASRAIRQSSDTIGRPQRTHRTTSPGCGAHRRSPCWMMSVVQAERPCRLPVRVRPAPHATGDAAGRGPGRLWTDGRQPRRAVGRKDSSRAPRSIALAVDGTELGGHVPQRTATDHVDDRTFGDGEHTYRLAGSEGDARGGSNRRHRFGWLRHRPRIARSSPCSNC